MAKKNKQSELKNETLYRTFTRNIPNMAFILFDCDLRYTLAEGMQLSKHGYSREMFVGNTIFEVFPPKIHREWAKYYRRALKGETIRLERKTDLGFFEIYVVPLKNEVGEIFAGMVMWHDLGESKNAQIALEESEARYRTLFENANDLIYIHDLEGNYLAINETALRVFGFTRKEALKLNMRDVVAPEHIDIVRRKLKQKIEGKTKQMVYEVDCLTKDGKRITLEVNSSPIYKEGVPVAVQGIARDITERKIVEETLKKNEERYRLMGESIMHQVWTAKPNGEIDYVNKRTLEYFGLDADKILKQKWQDVVHPNDLQETLERWNYSLATGEYYETEFRLLDKEGNYRWHLARATAGRDSEGNIIKWFGTNTDIHNQKTAEFKLNYFARHDTLTELPNRVEFMSQLKQTIERSAGNGWSRFAVLFLDLDRFKVINDSLGHEIGDKLLIEIAGRLKSCVRPGDVVARLGGDEFTILLNRTGEINDVVSVADRLQKRLSEPFKIDNYEVFTSASIGIIMSDGQNRQPEDFLRDADSAMYRAKEAGKARYEIFDREMHVQNMNLLQIETDLRRALERNEFEVNYQPIVSLETGKIVEFEALLRWRHPEHGLVSPNQFITVAEETGLIIPIGKWILEEACRQTVDWQKRFSEHKFLPISVNLSAKQLMHPNLTNQIKEVLVYSGLKPKCLQLEVTESTVMEHHETALKVLQELHQIGIHLSTDDFGTGYSSLSYLHRFPFDRLKIDRSFISKMDSETKSCAIVRTLLLLAQNLELEVVAEGIETESQLRQLQKLECGFGQGYLFSKPVNSAEAEKLLRDGVKNFSTTDSFVFSANRELIEINDIQ